MSSIEVATRHMEEFKVNFTGWHDLPQKLRHPLDISSHIGEPGSSSYFQLALTQMLEGRKDGASDLAPAICEGNLN